MTTQTKRDELNALADRCEREEASAELQQLIGLALGWTWKIGVSTRWFKPTGEEAYLPNWLRSLDAAVTLVPEGGDTFWRLGHDGTGPDPSVFKAEILVCSESIPGSVGYGATPALALCSAALRARASLTDGEDDLARLRLRTDRPAAI